MTPELADRVHDLLDAGAVLPGLRRGVPTCWVRGRRGVYRVQALAHRVSCSCEAGLAGAVCSHSLASQVVWQELADRRVEDQSNGGA